MCLGMLFASLSSITAPWRSLAGLTHQLWECRDREPLRLKKPAPLPKASPPPRRREPDYSVRLSIRPVTVLDRDYNDVIERYPRLYVSADFAKSVSSWIQVLITKPCMEIPLHLLKFLGVLCSISNLKSFCHKATLVAMGMRNNSMHHKLSGTHTKSAKPFRCLAFAGGGLWQGEDSVASA